MLLLTYAPETDGIRAKRVDASISIEKGHTYGPARFG